MRCYQPIFIVLALLLAGCAGLMPETPRERYAAVELVFTNAVEEIQRQHDFGVISQDTLDTSIKPIVRAGSAALDAASLALDAGDEVTLSEKLAFVRALSDQLRAFLIKETSSAEHHRSYLHDYRLLAQGCPSGV